jgi:signal peptidase II
MSRVTAFILAATTLFADQLSKLLVRARVQELDIVEVIPGCLNFIRSANKGIAFGMLSDSASPWTKAILILIAVVVMLVMGWLLWHAAGTPKQTKTSIALALILGGAAGNLFDRVAHGEVTDFIDFYIGRWHWYTFNVADAAITIAAGLFLLDILSSRARVVKD